MVPVIFMNLHDKLRREDSAEARAEAQRNASKEAAAVLGFTSAIGAYGAAIIPLTFGWSIKFTGAPIAALGGFVAFYTTCIAVTWWFYSRKGAECPC
jgi:NNP family nitrate/nitrite transporter-like MFS transporter